MSDEPPPRSRWWDDAFTRILLDAVPPNAATLIDVGCGVANAAHALLPARRELRYLGVDLDEARLATASASLAGRSYAPRVELRRAAAETLPVPDAVAEMMLFVLTLNEVSDVPRVLAEARRSLVEGGRLVAVEPDNLGTRLYFDGYEAPLSAAFHTLCEVARAAAAPADLAIGARVPSLVESAGLIIESVRAHALHDTRRESSEAFAARLTVLAKIIADKSALPSDAPALVAFEEVLADFARTSRTGWASHVVPVFVCLGMRPWVS